MGAKLCNLPEGLRAGMQTAGNRFPRNYMATRQNGEWMDAMMGGERRMAPSHRSFDASVRGSAADEGKN